MTLDDALRKAEAALDELVDDARQATEDMLRHRGASEEELDSEMNRFEQQAAALRVQVSATVRAMYATDGRCGIIQ